MLCSCTATALLVCPELDPGSNRNAVALAVITSPTRIGVVIRIVNVAAPVASVVTVARPRNRLIW